MDEVMIATVTISETGEMAGRGTILYEITLELPRMYLQL